jgi:hypothetical protein
LNSVVIRLQIGNTGRSILKVIAGRGRPLLAEASSFNNDLAAWDLSEVSTMVGMFGEGYGDAASSDQYLSSWNTSSVEDLS